MDVARKNGKTSAARRAVHPPAARGSAPSIYRHSDEVISRKNPDGSVSIMHFDNERYFFSITGIAAEFWSLLDGKRTIPNLQERLAKKHKVAPEKLSHPVQKLIRELTKEKLVVPA